MVSRTEAWATDAFSFSWQNLKPYIFSSFQSDQQGVDEDQRQSCKTSYTDYTTLDNTSVVSKAIEIVDCFANQIATVIRFAKFSSHPTKTPNEQKEIIPYCLSDTRRYLHSQGFREKTIKMLSKSWRKSTTIQYE